MTKATGAVLDEVMPVWTSGSASRIDVPPGASRVIDAAEQLTWADVPRFHRVVRLASMGVKKFPAEARVIDMLLDGPYDVVHRSDSEFVIAGVLPTSHRAKLTSFCVGATAEFAEYQPKSGTKVAMNFRVKDGVLSTETRNLPIGRAARVTFGAYWSIIKLPGGLIRKVWLKGVVERATRRSG